MVNVTLRILLALVACGLLGIGQSLRAAQLNLADASIADLQSAFTARAITCGEVIDQSLARIAAYDRTGPSLHAIQSISRTARDEAEKLDAAFASAGAVGPLHCVPVLVKDMVDVHGMPTTFGSTVFEHFVASRDATVIARLKRAGALILAKSTMGEFGSGYTSTLGGVSRNAYDRAREPSGSSGGTAAGVAAGFGTIGLGADTSGSIRGPAAFNSLVGLRPSIGLVSRHGSLVTVPSVDTLGPITRTVRDAALMLDVMAGYDAADATTAYAVGRTSPSYLQRLAFGKVTGQRLGIIRQPMSDNADSGSDDYRRVQAVVGRALNDLRGLGAEVIEVPQIANLPARLQRAMNVIVFETEEAFNSYLAQHPHAPVKTLRDLLLTGKVLRSRAPGLMNSVGKSTRDPGYLDALLAREELRQIVLTVMADHNLDAVVYATFDHSPNAIPEGVLNLATSPRPRGSNRSLSPATGFPAITVPAGFTPDGLPVGIEFLSRPFTEDRLLQLAFGYEQGTRNRKPPLLPLPTGTGRR